MKCEANVSRKKNRKIEVNENQGIKYNLYMQKTSKKSIKRKCLLLLPRLSIE